MKRAHVFGAAFGVLLLATLAFAQTSGLIIDGVARWVKGGLYVGATTNVSAARKNRISNAITVDVDHDFAASTIVCTDTPALTATGVKKGDPCMVGIGPRDGGTQIVTANSVFNCFSEADNEAKLRHCAVGTAANPADAGYVLRFISSQ